MIIVVFITEKNRPCIGSSKAIQYSREVYKSLMISTEMIKVASSRLLFINI